MLRTAWPNLAQIQRPVRDRLDAVSDELRRIVIADFPPIEEVNNYLLLARGKMFRPTLVLLSSQVGARPDPQAITLAATVELVHLATLVHDDAVDHSVLRRGMPTVNALWNHQTAVIMGDYLYSRSVASCKEKIQQLGMKPHYMEFELSKPRTAPTLLGRSKPESVMDVELPHQIATALYLTGASRYRVLRADVRHMHYREVETEPCRVVPNMGVGIVVLELDECIAVLVSSLDALTRTRVLKLRFPNTEHVEAFLPVTGDDHTSVIIEYSGHNTDGSTQQQRVAKLHDDMLARCLHDIYSRFVAGSPQLSDLAFNRKVVDVMDKAKTFARIRR
jgi:hypothetical protein